MREKDNAARQPVPRCFRQGEHYADAGLPYVLTAATRSLGGSIGRRIEVASVDDILGSHA